MKKLIDIFIAILFLVQLCEAQNLNYPKIVKSGKDKKEFVPKNYIILDSVSADLNKDNEPDFVLVVESKAKMNEIRESYGDSFEETNHARILIICFKDKNEYRLVESSNSFILRSSEGGVAGDPFKGINISPKGILEIEFKGGSNWRWELLYKFRYQENRFKLIGAESENYFSGDGKMDAWSFNFLSKKIKWTKGNKVSKKIDSSTWGDIEIKELKTFTTFKKPWTWQINQDIIL